MTGRHEAPDDTPATDTTPGRHQAPEPEPQPQPQPQPTEETR